MKQKKTYVVLDSYSEALFTTTDARLASKWRKGGHDVAVLPSEEIQERFRQGLKCWEVEYYHGLGDEYDAWQALWDSITDRDGVWEHETYYYVWAKTEKQAIRAVEKHRKEKGRKKLEMMRAIAKERKGKE